MQLHHWYWYTPLKELCQPHQFGGIDRCRKRVNHLINQLMNNDGICRAAPGFAGSANNLHRHTLDPSLFTHKLSRNTSRVSTLFILSPLLCLLLPCSCSWIDDDHSGVDHYHMWTFCLCNPAETLELAENYRSQLWGISLEFALGFLVWEVGLLLINRFKFFCSCSIILY